jgi:hypothetical protein
MEAANTRRLHLFPKISPTHNTHQKQKDSQRETSLFLQRAMLLEQKTGTFAITVPPALHGTLPRLAVFYGLYLMSIDML